MLTIDLLTGNEYIFNIESSSGSTNSTYPEVDYYIDLPLSSTVGGKTYLVRKNSGTFLHERKSSGFYYSSGTVWNYLSEITEYFKSNNFKIYDNNDNTKGISFNTTSISGNTELTPQNYNGTLAYIENINNVGVYDLNSPNFINNNDGTVTISSSNVGLRNDSNHQSPIKIYPIAQKTLILVDGGVNNYICVHNTGQTPSYNVHLTPPNGSDGALIYLMWRIGNNIHSANQDSIGLGLPNKINSRILNTEPYKLSSFGGLVPSESNIPTPRTILVSAAIVYKGVVPENVLDFNSSSGDNMLTKVLKVSSGYTYTSNLVYDNQHYNPYTGGELIIGNNNYAYRLYYRSIGDDREVFYVESPETYKSIDFARDASIVGRVDLPDILKNHAILIGRSLIQYNIVSGITEPFIRSSGYYASTVPNHSELPLFSLIWNNSKHIGDANNLAGFDVSGNTTNYPINQFVYNDDAIINDINISGKTTVIPSTINNISSVSGITELMLGETLIRIQGNISGNTIISRTPNIGVGNNGQIIILKGCSDVNLVTLQSENILNGSKLKLDNGINFTMGKGELIQLYYDEFDGFWYEMFRKRNSI